MLTTLSHRVLKNIGLLIFEKTTQLGKLANVGITKPWIVDVHLHIADAEWPGNPKEPASCCSGKRKHPSSKFSRMID